MHLLRTTIALVMAFSATTSLCAAGAEDAEREAQSAARHAIARALNAPDRPLADRERDKRSNPLAVLEHFGLQPGMTVLDLFAGGGYYSEIVARTVGTEGRTYMHNNAAYLGFIGDAADKRIANERVPNLIRYDRELDAIDLPEDSVDMVIMVMTYHDLYFTTDGWSIDPDTFFAMVHRVLKPGGVLGIVDHVALPGTGKASAQDLHRIDPEFARSDIEAHGFRFDGSMDALLNADDDLSRLVFDESVRGKTSRFVYRFISP